MDKKRAVLGLTNGKFSVSVIYCSLIEYNGQKGVYYARGFVLGKKSAINKMEEGFRKIVLQ